MFGYKVKLNFYYYFYIFIAISVNKAFTYPSQNLPCNCILLQSCDAFNTLIDESSRDTQSIKVAIQEAVCYFDGFQIFVCCPEKFTQKRHVKEKPKLDYLDELTGLNCPRSFGKEYNYDEYLKTHKTQEDDYEDDYTDMNEPKEHPHPHPHPRVVCDDWGNCKTFTFPTTKFPSYYHNHHHGDHDFYIPFFPHSHYPHNHNLKPNNPTIPDMVNGNSDNCGMLPQTFVTNSQVYPWITRLAYLNTTSRTIRYRCMGTIISDQHILTAAHCVDKLVQDLRLIYVRVGDDVNFEDFKIMETTVHPTYNQPLFNNDVAVLKLAKSQQTAVAFIQICLPQIDRQTLTGNTGVVAGTSTMDSTTIRYINLPIMNNTECAIRYAQYSENFETNIVITPTEFCAQAQSMNDVCEGDSGGPFMDRSNSGRFTLLGIVAFGPKTNCGQSNLPGVYMRISSYVDWIKIVIK